MLFNSYSFISLFLPATLLLFRWAGRWGGAPAAWTLTIASLAFYAWWSFRDLALLCVLLVINFSVGRFQEAHWKQRNRGSRLCLLAILALNLGTLVYFKYAHFLVDVGAAITGKPWSFPPLVLPLGISFFIFQKVAYQVDCFRGETHGYGFREFCTFVLFFPQLIAGPIVYHRDFIPQLRKLSGRIDAQLFARGMTLFIFGLGKKVVIADQLAAIAGPAFSLGLHDALGTSGAWLGATAYSLQLYFDFSGYSDMAMGLGWLFGIALPPNFDSPYKASSIVDFWRRWHMTLSTFLKSYLYIPLGGNRRSVSRRRLNLIITMGLGGLWHGAGWNFLVWGLLHGAYLVVNHAWDALLGRRSWRQSRAWTVAAQALTMWAVVVGWVLFRATNLTSALSMLKSMHFGAEAVASGSGAHEAVSQVSAQAVLQVAFCAAIALLAPNTWTLFGGRMGENPIAAKRLVWASTNLWAVMSALIAIVALLCLMRPSEFLYFQF